MVKIKMETQLNPILTNYKTNDTASEYKIHVEMESGTYATYETYSSGGGGIEYTGGEVGTAPAPTSLYVGYPSAQTGSSNPTNFAYSTPFFSAINNQGESVTVVKIQLTETTYATPIWDSGDISIASTANGARTSDIFYGSGNPPTSILEAGKTYYWHIRTKAGATSSVWSTDGTIGITTGSLTGRFYSGAGDGWVGYSYDSNDHPWSETHNATIGNWTLYSGNTAYLFSQEGYSTGGALIYTNNYSIGRFFLPFNTALLPESITFSNAKLYVYFITKYNGDNDGEDFVSIVRTTQASPTTLVGEDYDQAGAISNPVEGSNRFDITDMVSSGYNSWTLNSTGTGWISTTGWTQLGLREGHDILDSPIALQSRNQLMLRTSEYSGLSIDPYLEVTYSAPVAGGHWDKVDEVLVIYNGLQ